VEAAGNAHSTASAGYLPNVESRELPVRQAARVRSVDDVASTIIKYHEGAPVTIGQVADVRLGPTPRRGTGSERGHPAVVLSIQKSPGTNTLELTRRIDAAIDEIEVVMPAGLELNRHVMRQSDFITRSLDNVLHVLRDAVIIVSVILILFLMNFRATIITLTALPLSLAATLLVMEWFDLGINVMTLGGLAVAVGVLVDDAIIDVENVVRRLGQQRALPPEERKDFVETIFDASNEIRPAMVFATLIIVIVFVPLLFLGGLEGRFFRPLGLTYMISISASLLVALTVTPVLCRCLFRGEGKSSHRGDSFLVRGLKRIYGPTVRMAIRFRAAVLGAAVVATLLAVALASTFGTSFLPAFNEGSFTIFLMAPPGTSLDESDRLARSVERQLIDIEGVRGVTRRTGRAERDEHAEPVSSSEIDVTVVNPDDMLGVRREIERILDGIPGITTMVGQPIEHRLSHVLSGTPAALAINVFGDDLDELRTVAKRVESALAEVPGLRDVNASREVMTISLPIDYRHTDLAAAGLTPGTAAEQVRQALYGEVVATVNQGVRRYDLVVRLAPEERLRIEQVQDLVLRGTGGAFVRLSDVATVGPQRSSNLITRENARRKAVISANLAEGANLGDLVQRVRERVDPIVQAAGCTVTYGGQFEAQRSAARTIGVAGLFVALILVVLLQISTGSIRAALLVMLNLPLALIGGIGAIYLMDARDPIGNTLALIGLGAAPYVPPIISIASLVGFITLFGIAVRNGILLVNHYQHLIAHEGLSIDAAIRRGSMERLSPILMTAVCAALGLLPLALAAGRPGSELLAPLAIVVLGGLLSSTFLNLVVVPAGYALVFRRDQRASSADASTPDRSSLAPGVRSGPPTPQGSNP
jgi:HME family heavy-metal exporter